MQWARVWVQGLRSRVHALKFRCLALSQVPLISTCACINSARNGNHCANGLHIGPPRSTIEGSRYCGRQRQRLLFCRISERLGYESQPNVVATVSVIVGHRRKRSLATAFSTRRWSCFGGKPSTLGDQLRDASIHTEKITRHESYSNHVGR